MLLVIYMMGVFKRESWKVEESFSMFIVRYMTENLQVIY